MATAVVSAKKEINKGMHDEFPLRVVYSEKEPARNYIWGHPNGNFYVWTDCKWVKMEPPEAKKHEDHCKKCDCCDLSNYVTKDMLEIRLEKFKKEVISAFLRLTENKCEDSEAIEDYVKELASRISALEQKQDKDTIYDDSAIKSRISTLEQDCWDVKTKLGALEESSSDLTSKLNSLQTTVSGINSGLSNYYTKEEIDSKTFYDDRAITDRVASLESKVDNFVDNDTIYDDTGLTGRIASLENKVENLVDNDTIYDDTAVINRLSALEENNSQNQTTLSELDNRIDALEAIDHSTFITVDDLNPYATKQYVDDSAYDDESIKKTISDKELVTSAALNDLNSRVVTLESAGFITEHQSLDDYATKSDVESALMDKADKSEIPTNTSDLTNDSGFITEHQSLNNYYTKSETDTLLGEKVKMIDVTNAEYEALETHDTDVVYNITDATV